MLRAGLLLHKIEIQVKTAHRDMMGQEVVTWDAFAYAWASIDPLGGREYFAAQQIQSSISHKIMIRYQANIKPYHRIKWGEKIFDINAILNEGERNVSLILFCTEAV